MCLCIQFATIAQSIWRVRANRTNQEIPCSGFKCNRASYDQLGIVVLGWVHGSLGPSRLCTLSALSVEHLNLHRSLVRPHRIAGVYFVYRWRSEACDILRPRSHRAHARAKTVVEVDIHDRWCDHWCADVGCLDRRCRALKSSRLMMLPLLSAGFLRCASSSSVPAQIAIISPMSGGCRISREVNVSNGLALFRNCRWRRKMFMRDRSASRDDSARTDTCDNGIH